MADKVEHTPEHTPKHTPQQSLDTIKQKLTEMGEVNFTQTSKSLDECAASDAARATDTKPDVKIPLLHLVVLCDCPGLGAGDIVAIEAKQLNADLPKMEQYFALKAMLAALTGSAVHDSIGGEYAEAFKTLLDRLKELGAMPYQEFWAPWFKTESRIKILKGRLAISLAAAEVDEATRKEPKLYDKGGLHPFVIEFAIIQKPIHAAGKDPYPYPPAPWMDANIRLEDMLPNKKTNPIITAGTIAVRTPLALTDKEFNDLVELYIRTKLCVRLCPGVVSVSIEQNAPTHHSGRLERTTHRVLSIKGFGARVFDIWADTNKCVIEMPKIVVDKNGVHHLVIPNEECYEPCVMGVLRQFEWYSAIKLAVASVESQRPEDEHKNLYMVRARRLPATPAETP